MSILWRPHEDARMLAAVRECRTLRDAAIRVTSEIGRNITDGSIRHRLRQLGKRASDIMGRSRTTDPAPAPEVESEEPTIPIHWEDAPARAAEASSGTAPPVDREPYVPYPPRGPMGIRPHTPYIPEGHELGGVSTLTDASGAVEHQWNKTRAAGADEPADVVPPSFLLDKTSTMKRGDGSTVVQWSSYRRDDVERWQSAAESVRAHVAEYVRPAEPIAAPSATDDDLLTVYPLGDPHIGMMAWGEEVGDNFDLKIAEDELSECMRQLVARSPASRRCIITNLGDFFHAQDDSQRTPKNGNKLDVDGRAGKVGRVGLRILRTLIDTALTKHERVDVRNIPGNHDPTAAFWIPEVLSAAYSGEPRVRVHDAFRPYQYDQFGNVMIAWCHGDGAKLEAMAEIMATDEPAMWGATMFRVCHSGHVHHSQEKELRGATVYTHRTLAGRDAWHQHMGYRSGRSLRALTYHREYGLDSVAVVGVERVRAALEAA